MSISLAPVRTDAVPILAIQDPEVDALAGLLPALSALPDGQSARLIIDLQAVPNGWQTRCLDYALALRVGWQPRDGWRWLARGCVAGAVALPGRSGAGRPGTPEAR